MKIDGFKIVLTYENGILQTAATRGDGVTGEDVTQNIKTIESIPLKLEKPVSIVVEGEIWMSKGSLKNLTPGKRQKENLFSLIPETPPLALFANWIHLSPLPENWIVIFYDIALIGREEEKPISDESPLSEREKWVSPPILPETGSSLLFFCRKRKSKN